jgi:hypothetical protein
MNEGDKSLRQLQAELPWGANDYSEQYRADTTPHRDYKHAALHLVKSIGRLIECPEEMDHELHGPVAPGADADDAKRLADVVIVALRMANVHPRGPIDLARAVELRLAQKFGAGTRVVAGLPPLDPHAKAAKRECNRHVDCDAADSIAVGQGRPRAEHCHSEDCEDCFGR